VGQSGKKDVSAPQNYALGRLEQIIQLNDHLKASFDSALDWLGATLIVLSFKTLYQFS
jgi:hypothetical protein